MSDPSEVERLQRVAVAARDVLTTVHEGFREDIDFVPLWRALIEAGLMPVDPADWVGEEIPKPPEPAGEDER
jgi:hypothetical protein